MDLPTHARRSLVRRDNQTGQSLNPGEACTGSQKKGRTAQATVDEVVSIDKDQSERIVIAQRFQHRKGKTHCAAAP